MRYYLFVLAIIFAILTALWSERDTFAQQAEKPEFSVKEQQNAPILGSGASYKVGNKVLSEAEYKTEKTRLINKYKAAENKADLGEIQNFLDVIKIELSKGNNEIVEGIYLSK